MYIRVTPVERENVKLRTFSVQFQAIYLPVLFALQKNKTLQPQAERKTNCVINNTSTYKVKFSTHSRHAGASPAIQT